MRIIAVIPARGGSKGIPRKNIRLMDGKPLIAYAIENAQKTGMIENVLVSTDDEEIADISRMYGAKVIERPEKLGGDSVTLDPVIYHAVNAYEAENGAVDIVITMQPTSPLMTVQTLKNALNSYLNKEADTMISATNHPHLAWSEVDGKYVPLYKERLNRQYLPKHLTETGAFVISRREYVTEKSRFGQKVDLYEMPEEEAVDIDDYADWTICEMRLKRKKIIIRAEGYPEIGLGHIYRAILLSNSLMEHNVIIVLSEKSQLGIQKVRERFLKYYVIKDETEFEELLKQEQPDILINDILNTSVQYMENTRTLAKRVVNFEDIGEGSHLADAVINALYEKGLPGENYFWGHKYYCLRDEFLITPPREFSTEVENVLIAFGGTDPGHYTEKVLDVIESMPTDEKLEYQFVLGLGFDREKEFNERVGKSRHNISVIKDVKMMSKYMAKADIAISSQGRTMYELAAMKVPTIIMAQNERETTHEFGYLKNGFMNLGNGMELENETLREMLTVLIHTPQIRKQMRKSMAQMKLTDGIERVKNIILGTEA